MSTPRLTGSRCRCGGCGEYFNSLSSFDLHRAGIHGVGRYCRTPGEMLGMGMRRTDLGFWIERHRGESRQKPGPRAPETRSRLTLTQGAI